MPLAEKAGTSTMCTLSGIASALAYAYRGVVESAIGADGLNPRFFNTRARPLID